MGRPLFDGRAGSVDLLVSDVLMDGLTGADLSADLPKRTPKPFISGYSEDAVPDLRAGCRPFPPKPFAPAALVTRVDS